jgi:hypothetical protein
MKNVPHALATRHVKKICDASTKKKGRQTYRNRSERPPPPYTPMNHFYGSVKMVFIAYSAFITILSFNQWMAITNTNLVVTFHTSALIACTFRTVLLFDSVTIVPRFTVFTMSSIGVLFTKSTITSHRITSTGVG